MMVTTMHVENDKIVATEGEKWDASVMRVNTDRETLLENINGAIKRQLPQMYPHAENPQHIAIVGGGWSLLDTVEELRALYFDGVKLIAVNGSARWLMERNLRPSMHVVLDARAENAEFLRDPIPHCKYFLASQCHPDLFDIVADRETYLFHAVSDSADVEADLLNAFYLKRWARVPTAGTVGVTSVMLMRLLGFRYQHLFGLDSCYAPSGNHHAYPQAMNDGEGSAIFKIAERTFECSAWQASQARSFIDMLSINGEHVDLEIHGDGMLAHIVKYGAEMPEPTVKETDQ